MVAVVNILNSVIYAFIMFMSSYLMTTKVFRWRVHRVFLILAGVSAVIDGIYISLIYFNIFIPQLWELASVANEINLLIAFIICIEGKWYKRIAVGYATFILGSLFVQFCIEPLYILCPDDTGEIYFKLIEIALACFALGLIYVASLPGRKLKGKRIGAGLIWLITVAILVFDVLLEATMLAATEQSDNMRRGVSIDVTGAEFMDFVQNGNLLVYCMLIFITFLVLYGINFFMSQRFYRREAEMNANFLDAQAKYYETVQQNNNEIRSLRHDYRNHLTVLALLLENNDVDKAKSYIEDLSGTLASASSICNTGDQIADAIVSEKILKAQSLGVNLSVEGLFSYKDMKAVDTCSILGNILDNAIEAVTRERKSKQSGKNKGSSKAANGEKMELSSKNINLVFKKTDSFFMISETNRSLNPLEYDGSKVVSSKEKKDLHGMGIGNIRASVEHYEGDVEVKCVPSPDYDGEYVFTIKIVLPISE